MYSMTIPVPNLILPPIENIIALNNFMKSLSEKTKEICDRL